jgi:hypothetical protein
MTAHLDTHPYIAISYVSLEREAQMIFVKFGKKAYDTS